MPSDIIFINSHPIQYFAPLYKFMNTNGMSVTAWYCSDENIKGHFDRQFNSNVAWDIPILEGYPSRFFKNHSWKPSLYNGFFGLINLTLLSSLWKQKKSIVVVHGWGYLTNVLAILIARLSGHVVCLRGESPLNQELAKGKFNRFLKRIFLQAFLFRFVNSFLYIGSQNKAFYQYYGVNERKLVFVPYAVDNERFREAAKRLLPTKFNLRERFGLPPKAQMLLFTAKYIDKKNPMDLLKAYKMLGIDNTCLVMVGEGKLREEMEKFIQLTGLSNVFLTGFVNQTEIENYYAMADVFILCSGQDETWGLSVNEAMNFGLPLVVSDTAGCSFDLVREGQNGHISITGDPNDMARKIKLSLALNNINSTEIVDAYSYETIVDSFKTSLIG